MALRIGSEEGADGLVVELAALLHETGDAKVVGAGVDPGQATREWLRELQASRALADCVGEIVAGVSFRGAQVSDVHLGLEGRCVRDADRLDAIGAIGIARAFAYGGSMNRPIYDPAIGPMTHVTVEQYRASDSSTINHFREKLLLLRDRMETHMGQRIAVHRHEVMVEFLDEFLQEWDLVA
jgi:uncharacterized protein